MGVFQERIDQQAQEIVQKNEQLNRKDELIDEWKKYADGLKEYSDTLVTMLKKAEVKNIPESPKLSITGVSSSVVEAS